MTNSYRWSFLLIALIGSEIATSAQVTTGTPPFGSFGGGPDVINLANLNAHLTIPVLHKPGRGMNFTYDLSYDSSVWYPVTSGSTTSWQPVGNWGWRGQTDAAVGYVSYSATPATCYSYDDKQWESYTQYYFAAYVDAFGTTHPIATYVDDRDLATTCLGGVHVSQRTVTDGSGLAITVTADPSSTVSVPDGTAIYPPLQIGSAAASTTDRNGNQISINGSGVFTDTLGTTALTVSGSGTPASPRYLTYTAPSGASPSYTMKYSTYTVQTSFGCSGITDYGPTSASLVSEIDLPDFLVNPNDKYIFTYEPTFAGSPNVTGRLKSVTLPAGGTITYTYTGGSSGNITCADGSTSGLQRYTPDTGSNYWNYARSGTSPARTTTVTDPLGNNTVVQFQGIYETQRDSYQGAISPSNLLQTVKTCYNGNTSNCTGTAITLPISQRNIFTVLPNNQQSEHDDFRNTYGAPTETDDYDYGAAPHGPLLKKVLATYATNLGNITAFRQTVTTQDGNLNTVTKVTYNYDETTPTPTTGTPQHVTVSAPLGNLTSTSTYVNSTLYMSKVATYYDTGNLKTRTDVNGGITTYNYASGLASCYNSFPTSITEAVTSLSTSMTWNCTGGVQLTSVDENNQTTTTIYNDAYFWHPASTADPTGAVTSFCYGLLTSGTCTLSPSQIESTLNFNSGNSTVDALTTLDSLGRAHIQQTRHAPGSPNFDSVETDYDALGHVSRVTLAYVGTAGQTTTQSAPGTSTTYDAMNRPLAISDGGGGSTAYNYGLSNDVLVTRNPAPAWDSENTKQRQLEYDAIGRLTSVCEVTAGTASWPGGTCAQNVATQPTGYWTKYTYDPMGNLMTVTQNAQAATSLRQSRSYTYDWMSRMTSETVPEIGATGNGTAYYTYDSDSTCGTSYGDLVKRVDAAGNVICSTYDALHRVTSITYPSGPNMSVTPMKVFYYDTSHFNATNNTHGRLASAGTCQNPTCAGPWITAEDFSYSARGELTDLFEWTSNSGGWYHTSQSYWANGGPNQTTGNISLPTTITYGPDGEGRTSTVSASSGQNPVSSTTYNAASLPTAINLGSGAGDTDAYQYDSNTNRMTQYQFTVNSTSLTGALGWNTNGTLQTQNITDGFNTADTQNCSYGYDDITRLASANCGSAAAQAFSFDPFGNINKSGSPYSFQPTYSSSTNRMTLIGGSTPTYDNNGNVTNDTFRTYAWDADSRPVTVDTANLTYDALGRMVEQNRSGTYTQIAYSPTGQKLALMSGQTLQKAMVPLTGKALAVYNPSGLQYYAHPDLLGSIRLATTPARAMYFDTAYAPFGETYATSGTADPAYTGQMNDTAHRQDTAGGLYDFPVREYSTQGRWPSPDPAGIAATCPKDPQSQNRYAYVRNNPITRIDPTGAFDEGDCDPWEDPFCGIGIGGGFGPGSGGGGGGGSPEKPRAFPWPLLPPAFFAVPPEPNIGSRWSCLNTNDGGKPFWGVCNYVCKRLGFAKFGANNVDLLVSFNRIKRECNWKGSACPGGLIVKGAEAEIDPLLFGWSIEKCYAEGAALIP